jgi:hypothetical protein
MSRIARNQTVSPKVYRHFAVITVILTACTAMFADGEATGTVADRMAERGARNELLSVESQKVGARHVKMAKLNLRNEKRSYFAFAPEMPENAANDGAAYQGDSGIVAAPRASRVGPPMGPPGAGQDTAESGSAARQRSKPRQASKPAAPSADQLETLLAQSRARSGASEEE